MAASTFLLCDETCMVSDVLLSICRNQTSFFFFLTTEHVYFYDWLSSLIFLSISIMIQLSTHCYHLEFKFQSNEKKPISNLPLWVKSIQNKTLILTPHRKVGVNMLIHKVLEHILEVWYIFADLFKLEYLEQN